MKNCKTCAHNVPMFHPGFGKHVWRCMLKENLHEDEPGDAVVIKCGGHNDYLHYAEGGPTEPPLDSSIASSMLGEMLYKQLKAKIFNVLESQMDRGARLDATKDLTENIISNVAEVARNYVKDTYDIAIATAVKELSRK